MTTREAQSSTPSEEADRASARCDAVESLAPATRETAASPVVDDDHVPRPPQALSGPGGAHRGWAATVVSTAKCDMCHRQRCGTIQQCCECKLLVCAACAAADYLRDDARHDLDPQAVDWAGPVPALSRPRTRRRKEARGGRGGALKALKARPRPAVAFASPLGPAAGLDAAEILSQMPRSQSGGASRQPPPPDPRLCSSPALGLVLPPVRAEPAARQPDPLPPLRALHPQFGVDGTQLSQPWELGEVGLPLFRPGPLWTYAGHDGVYADAPLQGSELASAYRFYQAQEYSPWGVQQHHFYPYQSSTPAAAAAVQSRGPEEPDSYGAFATASAALHSGQKPPSVSWIANPGDPLAAYYLSSLLRSWAPRHDGRLQGPHPPPLAVSPPPEHGHQRQAPAPPRVDSPPRSPGTSLGPPYVPPRATIPQMGAALTTAALAIQAREQPGWPLDSCLRLALARRWARGGAADAAGPPAGVEGAFCELRAATGLAVVLMGLPERHNAARAWLCELQRLLFLGDDAPPLGFAGLLGRGDGE